jgi:protease PrsW
MSVIRDIGVGRATATARRMSRYVPWPVVVPLVAIGCLIVAGASWTLTEQRTWFVYALLQGAVFLALIRYADVYEREPLPLVAAMAVWGATGAVSLATWGNSLVRSWLPKDVALVYGDAIAAPLVEETTKGIALITAFLLAFWVNRRFYGLEFEGVTDGAVYGAAVGLGYSFAEDIRYFLQYGWVEYAERVDFLGPQMLLHAMLTATFGVGLGLATWSRSTFAWVGFPVLGLVAAMVLHAAWNGAPATALVIADGWNATVSAFTAETTPPPYESMLTYREMSLYVLLAGFAALWLAWLRHQRRVLEAELAAEVDLGSITGADVAVVCRYGARQVEYWRLRFARRSETARVRRRRHARIIDLGFALWRAHSRPLPEKELDRRRALIALLREQELLAEHRQL